MSDWRDKYIGTQVTLNPDTGNAEVRLANGELIHTIEGTSRVSNEEFTVLDIKQKEVKE